VEENREVKPLAGFIDLHTHTAESDGTFSPEQLVELAGSIGLDAIAITDHDTFSGFERATSSAHRASLQVIRGIELNSRLALESGGSRSAHILAYFPEREPASGFTSWLSGQAEERRERNRKLEQSLRARGLDIELVEVEARGKALTGRVHFARVLVEKGYVASIEDAFARYLGESAPTFVERQSYSTEQTVRMIREGGGVPVVAHPVRLSLGHDEEARVLRRLKDEGLAGLEIYHSEHSAEMQARYRKLAGELKLIPTGGSDFHGRVKPGTELGRGVKDNLRVPREFLVALCEFARSEN
jgi:predicted metal-dependent phosphoesterase TrpH